MLLAFSLQQGFAQDLQFGIELTPFVSNTLNPALADITTDGGVGIGGKLVVDYPLSESAFISSGIELVSFSNTLGYNGVINATDTTGASISPFSEMKATFINIPIALKLKTSQFGLFTPFAMLGFEPGFSFGEKVDTEYPESVVEFGIRPINIPLSIAAGTEFQISETNAAYASLFYRYGFNNIIKDNYEIDGDKLKSDGNSINMTNFGLRIGFLF